MNNVNALALDYKSLRLLLSVVDAGSMSAAAHQLGLSQSAVSHSVERLRGQLNDPLFVKIGKKVMPTQFLITTAPRLRRILADLEALPNHQSFSPAEYDGPISIAANITELIPELLRVRKAISAQAPRATIRLIELGSRAALAPILNSSNAAVAISVRMTPFPAVLSHEPFFDDGFEVFYDPDQRAPVQSIDDYANADHAVLDFGGDAPSTVDTILVRAGLSRRKALGVPNVACMEAFLRGTPYICTMQSRLQHDAFSTLANCPVPFDMGLTHFDTVWHKRNDNDPLTCWLRELIQTAATRES